MKRLVLNTWSLGAAVALLAGCGGSQPPVAAAGPVPQSRAIATHLYVANLRSASVTVYASDATGNLKPTQEIQGSKTDLSRPHDVAVDGNGDINVVNVAPASVTVYASGAAGNATPIAIVSGSKTGLDYPAGIAIDSGSGDIYVSNMGSGRSDAGSVTIYASGSNGNASPIGVIDGSKTRLEHPDSVALDPSGNIFVTNLNDSVTIYPAGRAGNIAPERTIEGDRTSIKDPTKIALDSSLNAYVTNFDGNTLTVYAAGADGNAAPIQKIHGERTGLRGPFGIAVDASGKIYAASGGIASAGRVTVYAAGSNGPARPIGTIEGNRTALDFPNGIAIH